MGPILRGVKKVRLSVLRRIIREALADHMRLPKGENSRDDANDRNLNDPAPVGTENIETFTE